MVKLIADAIKRARGAHRAAVEAVYGGRCSVYGMQPVKDPLTKVTRMEEILVQQDICCHLSYAGAAPVADSEMVAVVSQTVKLFLAPEIVVPPGSRIVVTQQERTGSYSQSGKPAVYASHQEILLELWKGYA